MTVKGGQALHSSHVEVRKVNRAETKQQIKQVKIGAKAVLNSQPQAIKDIVQSYVMTLLNPKKYIGRYPDSFPRKTGVFRSIAEYYVPLRFGTDGVARFSLCAKPIMGSLANVNNYQLSMVNVDTNLWSTTDWTSAATYLQSAGGADPRIDINSAFLTGPPAGYYYGEFVAANPAVDGSSVLYSTLTPGNLNNAINVQRVSGNSFLRIPAGIWLVTFDCVINLTNTAAATFDVRPFLPGASTQGTMTGTSGDTMSQGTVVTTAGQTDVYLSRSFVCVTNNPNNVIGATMYRNGAVIGAGILSGYTGSVTISPISPTNVGGATNAPGYGIIEEIRPVAQSVLVTYMGSDLLNGGTIASCYVPNDILSSNYFANTEQSLGQLQYVENVMKLDGSYNGPLKTGTYAWWSPYDDTDANFRSVGNMNSMGTYPGIVVSGIFNPSSTMSSGSEQLMMRVELCTVLEYITKATCMDLEHCVGSQTHIDAANNAIMMQPHCMPNGKHFAWLKEMAGKVAGFTNANRAWLVPLAKTIGTALL